MKPDRRVVPVNNGLTLLHSVNGPGWVLRRSPQTKKTALRAAACLLFMSMSLLAHGQQGIYRGHICVTSNRSVAFSDQSNVRCDVENAKRGQRFVFVDVRNKGVFQVDGKNPKAFVGKDVVVVGIVDKKSGTIDITDVYRALPPKVTEAKTLYIDCDACPRGMAAAWRAAFEALTDWGRFDVLPDPANADLILLLSANPYLGDYITRDGPDTRPVHVDITYMNVVDPKTGESLWGGWKEWGSFLVSEATKVLIDEFRQDLKLEEGLGKT